MYVAHVLYDLFLHLITTLDLKVRQEVVCDGNQSILRPALEPIHRAARDQTRELQRAGPELLTNLQEES